MIPTTAYRDAAYNDRDMIELTWLILIIDQQGRILRFTSHDQELTTLIPQWGQHTPTAGVTTFATRNEVGLSVNNTELRGLISNDDTRGVTFDNLKSGVLRGGRVERLATSWRWPTIIPTNFPDAGGGRLYEVWDIAGVDYDQHEWRLKLEGLRNRPQRKMGEIHSRTCQNQLGVVVSGQSLAAAPSFCQLDIQGFPYRTIDAEVVNIVSRRQVGLKQPAWATTTLVPGTSFFAFQDDYFTFGHVEIDELNALGEKSPNGGAMVPIEKSQVVPPDFQLITFTQPLPFDLQQADRMSVVVGCDHQLSTCENKFANTTDFRGDPYIPGTDATLSSANTLVF